MPRFTAPVVSSADILPGAVTTAALADGAVTTVKIANLAVTTAKIANLAVTTAQIANLAVTDAKIDTLSASKITAGTISASLITVATELRMATGAKIAFTRNSTALITTNHAPANGDFWVNIGAGGSVGRIQGMKRSGGVDLVAGEMQIVTDGFAFWAGAGLPWEIGDSSGAGRLFTGSNLGSTSGTADRVIFDKSGWGWWSRSDTSGGQIFLQSRNGTGQPDHLLTINGSNVTGRIRSQSTTGGIVIQGSGSPAAVYVVGRTTTNSGLAAWRNDGFPGTELLALSSSAEAKTAIRDLAGVHLRRVLDQIDAYRPRRYRSLADGDDGRRVFLGLIAEEAGPDFTYEGLVMPLLVAVQDLRRRVAELEAR